MGSNQTTWRNIAKPNQDVDRWYNYYENPSLPWKCIKCAERFRLKKDVSSHVKEVHAY